ncbi:MAG: hypothetical protein JSV80_02065 [Acidobacteriota bacterium]|nr:MAG: hypothetical protein JSV80_02065 [Acidobacteriota bacterium]
MVVESVVEPDGSVTSSSDLDLVFAHTNNVLLIGEEFDYDDEYSRGLGLDDDDSSDEHEDVSEDG